jgi:hypothetical protein
MDGGKREHRRPPVQPRKVVLRGLAQKRDMLVRRERPDVNGVVALGLGAIVAARPDDAEVGSFGKGIQESVDPLMRRDAPHKKDAASAVLEIGPKPLRIDAAVNDPRPIGRAVEQLRGVSGDSQETIEPPIDAAGPPPGEQSVVGRIDVTPSPATRHGHDPARGAVHVVHVHNICIARGRDQTGP